MKTIPILAGGILLLLTACNDDQTTSTSQTGSRTGSQAPAQERSITDGQQSADNSGRNERDRAGTTRTAGDQSESEGDLKITQEIRQALVADDALSIKAKNVKVITIDGVVALRGPVDSEGERSSIASKATAIAGVQRVDNQLEVVRK